MPTQTASPRLRHGTPEGHLAGCKGDRVLCPAVPAFGMSCTTAWLRATTTPDRYYKAKARDPRPAAIARTLGYRPRPVVLQEPPEPVQPSPRARPRRSPEAVAAEEQRAAERAHRDSIRKWAAVHGLWCSPRGMIPAHILAAYNARDGRS